MSTSSASTTRYFDATLLLHDNSRLAQHFLEAIICSSCHHIIQQPLMISSCDHVACKKCLAHSTSCPECNLPFESKDLLPCLFLERFLERVPVRCCHWNDRKDDHQDEDIFTMIILSNDEQLGCPWTGRRDQLESHVATVCEWTSLPCKFCQVLFRRGDMMSHEAVCVERTTVCDLCDAQFPFRVSLQHRDRCLQGVIVCETGCGTRLLKERQQQHNEKWCTLALVTCDELGCGQVMRRQSLATHKEHDMDQHRQLREVYFKEQVKLLEAKTLQQGLEIETLKSALASSTSCSKKVPDARSLPAWGDVICNLHVTPLPTTSPPPDESEALVMEEIE